MFSNDTINYFKFMSSYVSKKEVYAEVLNYIEDEYEYYKDLNEDYLANILMEIIYETN